MADFKSITNENGNTYNVKDATARELLSKIGNKLTVFNFTYPTLTSQGSYYAGNLATNLNLTNARIVVGYVSDTTFNQNKPINWYYRSTSHYSCCITLDGSSLGLSASDNNFAGFSATVIIASD